MNADSETVLSSSGTALWDGDSLGQLGGVGARPQLTRRQQVTIMVTSVVGTLALFPQGLVPLIFLSPNPTRAWFFALCLPAPWDLLTTVAMIVAGLLLYGHATRLYVAVTPHRSGLRS